MMAGEEGGGKRSRFETFKPSDFEFSNESVHEVFNVPTPGPIKPDPGHVVLSEQAIDLVMSTLNRMVSTIYRREGIEVPMTMSGYQAGEEYVPPEKQSFYARTLEIQQFNLYLQAVARVPVNVWSTLRRLLLGFYAEPAYKSSARAVIVVVDQAALSSGFVAKPTDYTFDETKIHSFVVYDDPTDPNSYTAHKAASIPEA